MSDERKQFKQHVTGLVHEWFGPSAPRMNAGQFAYLLASFCAAWGARAGRSDLTKVLHAVSNMFASEPDRVRRQIIVDFSVKAAATSAVCLIDPRAGFVFAAGVLFAGLCGLVQRRWFR